MTAREHIWIPKLKQQLADKKIDRREFIRYSTLLGMSASAAYMWAGKITGEPIAQPAWADEIPKGGTVRIAQRIPKLDSPHTFSWVYDSNVVRQVCGYLTRTGVDNVTRPHLASKWEASEDHKTWTFTMSDTKWRKGEPFTAEHAAWNIKHCLDPKVGSSVVGLMKGYMLKDVDTGTKDDKGNEVMSTELWNANAIEVKDPKTLVLHLKEAQVAVPEHFFHYPFLMLDPAENGVFGIGSNGTGSFDLTELEVGRKAVLKRLPDQPGYVDELHFIDLGDNPSAVAAALASKQVDGITQGNIEQFEIYKAMDEQWKAGGIRAKINVLPSAKFWEVWDKVPFGFTEWTHRPLGFMVLALAYRTGVPWNESAYSNKQFDQLLSKAEGTLDVDARREIIGELEKIMQEDGPIAQPLWRSVYTGFDKRVKGFQIHPTLYIFGETMGIESA